LLLTADLGNTHCSLALTRRGKPLRFEVLPSRAPAARFEAAARKLLTRGGAVEGCVVASVVPERTAILEGALRRATGLAPLRFQRDLDAGLVVKPRPASRIGADRLANAAGAIALFPGPRPLVVVDVGTAVTVDLVTRDLVTRGGVFEGGMIAPGPRLGARALTSYTAQLPDVRFAPARTAAGRSTHAALTAGLWFGFRGLVKGLVEAALREAPDAEVVVAGGDGRACLEGSGLRCRFVPHLTHSGLAASYRRAHGR
jgi:type III pantothenate kinase